MEKIRHIVIPEDWLKDDLQRQLLWAYEDVTNAYIDRLNKEEESNARN